MGNSAEGKESGYQDLLVHPEERLRLIEENVRDYAIFVVDPKGRIASWNIGAERILGYSTAEAVGMNCENIFTPEDRADGAVDRERTKATKTGRSEDARWHMRKDGSRFWGNGIMTALRDEAGKLRGFVKILRDETERKRAEEEREQARAIHLEQERQAAVLQERYRMAQEIHDTLAQGFTGINIQLEAAEDVLDTTVEEARKRIAKAKELARLGLMEARRSVWALRPQILEQNGLVGAFTNMAAETRIGTSLSVRCSVEGIPVALPEEVENHLLRIAQEAVTNVLRHSGATEIQMMLTFDADAVRLQVQDDGRGFETPAPGTGFGLSGMRERALSIGGQWTLTSSPGAGTQILVTVPIQR